MVCSPSYDQPDGTDLLYDVIDHIPAGILVVSLPEFRILAINARACVRFGIPITAHITGRLCSEVIPRFAEDRLDELWLSTAGIQTGNATPPTEVGGALTRRWNAYAVCDPSGRAVRLLLVWFEASVTPEHQFASSAQQITRALISILDRDQLLDLILEQLHGVVVYDRAMVVLRDEDGYYIAACRGLPAYNGRATKRVPATNRVLNQVEAAYEPVIVRGELEVEDLCGAQSNAHIWLGVPLRAQGDVVGILLLTNRSSNHYTRADAAQAQAFAAYAALVVRNAELYYRAREQSARLALVNRIARMITATHDLHAIFAHLIEHLHGVVPLDIAELALFDPATRRLTMIARHPPVSAADATNVDYSSEDALFLQRLIDQRQPRLLSPDDVAAPEIQQRLICAGIRSCLVVPIVDEGYTSGALLLGSHRTHAFPAIEIRMLADLAQHLAVAIQNAQLHQAREKALADLRLAQQRLIQSERLTAVGELVAGVAHELNNPLTAVLGFANILQQTAPTEYQHDLAMIVESATRARRIVQNLLTFARQRQVHREEVDLNLAVRQVLSLLAYHMRTHHIVVEERLKPNLPLTTADATAIKQVVLNLLNNAQQALASWHGERRILISTDSEWRDGQEWLILRISDTGPGIAPEHLPLIFEPFFTTKPVGEGTGLGLSICYGIVTQYHGHIHVHSVVGSGASFTVELPVQACLESDAASSAPTAVQPERQYHVLVVDDEAAIAELIARLLRERGYTVDICRDGGAALDRINRTAYDLLICDVRMPGMSGDELFANLSQRAPHLTRRVLFVSGDTASYSTREFLERSGVRYVEKPFDAAEFVNIVRQALAEPS